MLWCPDIMLRPVDNRFIIDDCSLVSLSLQTAFDIVDPIWMKYFIGGSM